MEGQEESGVKAKLLWPPVAPLPPQMLDLISSGLNMGETESATDSGATSGTAETSTTTASEERCGIGRQRELLAALLTAVEGACDRYLDQGGMNYVCPAMLVSVASLVKDRGAMTHVFRVASVVKEAIEAREEEQKRSSYRVLAPVHRDGVTHRWASKREHVPTLYTSYADELGEVKGDGGAFGHIEC
jgi:hypothetical protein